jgi:hypothetical protein
MIYPFILHRTSTSTGRMFTTAGLRLSSTKLMRPMVARNSIVAVASTMAPVDDARICFHGC